jgi:hypothetical protein
MKLGIAVVYLVSERNGALLDVHLSRIAGHTSVPYTIYAGANRLLPQYRARLEREPRVRIVECSDTGRHGGAEHAHYLEHLVRAAIDDGVTHVAVLHVDSFPVCDGWAEKLAARLSDPCALVTVPVTFTALLMFRREFYLACGPRFELTPEDERDPACPAYREKQGPYVHSGSGYLFAAERHGLTWERLDGDRPDAADYGVVYAGAVFHLNGAARLDVPAASWLRTAAYGRTLGVIRAGLHAVMSERQRARWARRLGAVHRSLVQRPVWQAEQRRYEAARARLLADPDRYLEEQIGKGHGNGPADRPRAGAG